MILDKPFGFYKANTLEKIILLFVKLGFSRGVFRKILSKIWSIIHQKKPIDVNYQELNLRLYPHNSIIENKILLSSKTREERELFHLNNYLKEGGTFIDIGANIGYYSLMAARHGAEKILSVEPNPITFKRLQQNIDLNNFSNIIQAHNIGLGAQDNTTLELTISDSDLGGSSAINKSLTGQKEEIQIKTLATHLKENNVDHLQAMKIDIEGMEDQVLFPYFKDLEKENFPKIIIIEENKDLWERDITQWLLDNGYRLEEKTRSNLILVLNQ